MKVIFPTNVYTLYINILCTSDVWWIYKIYALPMLNFSHIYIGLAHIYKNMLAVAWTLNSDGYKCYSFQIFITKSSIYLSK